MTNSKNRLAVDLDDLENQLRQGQPQADPGRGDPLAELARIVGQEDPFRSVLGEDSANRAGSAAPKASAATALSGPASYPAPSLETGVPTSFDRAHEPYPGEALAAYAPEHDGHYGDDHGFEYEAVAPTPQYGTERDIAQGRSDPRRSRRGLVAVGAVLGVAVLGVAGALAFRGGHGSGVANGAPPIIQADRNPLKVQPQNPGGTEIPDQNKQIYDRRAPQGQTRVVNREEQPVDVQQAARAAATDSTASLPASTATPGSGSSGSASGSSSLTASLGEPKRVRTVSVKPDLGVSGQSGSASTAPRPALSASATTPAAPPVPTPAPPSRPSQEVARPSAPIAAATPAASAASTDDQRAPADEARAKAAQRVASATPAPIPEKSVAGSGGFAVQLAVRPSDKEARAAYKELQQKFAGTLDGRSPMILQAEVNGKTVYRIRVGPLPREEANSLCTKLQGAGGQCFVAKN